MDLFGRAIETGFGAHGPPIALSKPLVDVIYSLWTGEMLKTAFQKVKNVESYKDFRTENFQADMEAMDIFDGWELSFVNAEILYKSDRIV